MFTFLLLKEQKAISLDWEDWEREIGLCRGQAYPYICSSGRHRTRGVGKIADKKSKLFFNKAPWVTPCCWLPKKILNSGISEA